MQGVALITLVEDDLVPGEPPAPGDLQDVAASLLGNLVQKRDVHGVAEPTGQRSWKGVPSGLWNWRCPSGARVSFQPPSWTR